MNGIELGILGSYIGSTKGKIKKSKDDTSGQEVEYRLMYLLAQARCNYMFTEHIGIFMYIGGGPSLTQMRFSNEYKFDAGTELGSFTESFHLNIDRKAS